MHNLISMLKQSPVPDCSELHISGFFYIPVYLNFSYLMDDIITVDIFLCSAFIFTTTLLQHCIFSKGLCFAHTSCLKS